MSTLSEAQVIMRRLTEDDAAACVALCQAVGWIRHDLSSWIKRIRLAGEGSFGLFVDERLVGTALGLAYDQSIAWVGVVVTHPDFQRRGYSTRLMETVLDYLKKQGVQCIMLDATPQGRPVYERVGFHPLYRVEVWQGIATPHHDPNRPAVPVHPGSADDLPAIIALDAGIFGTPRPKLITEQFDDFPELAWVSYSGDQLEGFLLANWSASPDGEKFAHVGPWYHSDPAGAEALLVAALHALAGLAIRFDVPEQNEAAKKILAKHGFEHLRSVTRMVYGDAVPPGRMSQQYSVSSVGTG